jgi:hypothetical protein
MRSEIQCRAYGNSQSPPEVRMSAVLLVDLLGHSEFSNGLGVDEASARAVSRCWNALAKARDCLADYDDGRYAEIAYFSDHVAIGWPLRQDGEVQIGGLLTDAGLFQRSLVLDGLPVRGGLAVGYLCMDKLVIAGPALIEAHKLEAEQAVYPRIILNDTSLQLVLAHLRYYNPPSESPQDTCLVIDVDGQACVNYLLSVSSELDEGRQENLAADLEAHKNLVTHRLREFKSNAKVLAKYEWMAHYHNFVIEQWCKARGDLVIDLAQPPRGFRRLSDPQALVSGHVDA